ncbi:unnamed protein product [Jaminaea pallidilutea]
MHSFGRLWTLFLVCLLDVGIIAGAAADASSSPPVNIRLKAPWEQAPLLLEAIESLALEAPKDLPGFLTCLTSDQKAGKNSARDELVAATSGREVYRITQRCLSELGLLADHGSRSNWEMSLALHSHSPKIAAHWQSARTTGAYQRWLDRVRGEDHEQCGSWVDWYGHVACSSEELQKLVAVKTPQTVDVPVYPFDHQLYPVPGRIVSNDTAVLYADPLSANFFELHSWLSSAATRDVDTLRYILRWQPPAEAPAMTNASLASGYLAGYGAALDLKKVDYLVIDDRKLSHASGAPKVEKGTLSNASKQQVEDREWLNTHLRGDKGLDSHEALSETELSAVGLRAAQAIVQSPDPVRALAQISQDFPLHVTPLGRGQVRPSPSLRREIDLLQTTKVRPGTGNVWLNGKPLASFETVPLGLMKLLRSERALVKSLLSSPLKLEPAEAIDILSSPSIGRAQSQENEKTYHFDASDRIEKAQLQTEGKEDAPGAIVWFNDIEEDEAFAHMGSSLRNILRPVYPGQFPTIRRNLFNAIVVLDLADKAACAFIAEQIMPLTNRIALRWGFVPGRLEQGGDGDSTKIARLYWHLLDTYGLETATEYVGLLSMIDGPTDSISANEAERLFDALMKDLKTSSDPQPAASDVASQPGTREDAARHYIARLHLQTDDEEGHMLLNGQYFPIKARGVFQKLLQLVSIQTQAIARPIYYGDMTDDEDVSTYFYDLPSSLASRSELVFPRLDANGVAQGPKSQAVDLAQTISETSADDAVFSSFLYPSDGATDLVNATMWLIADFDSEGGLSLARAAVSALRSSNAFRLAFIQQRDVDPNGRRIQVGDAGLSTFLAQMHTNGQLSEISPGRMLDMLNEVELVPATNLDDAGHIAGAEADHSAYASEAKLRGWNVPAAIEAEKFWSKHSAFAARAGVKAGQAAVLVNGRLLSGIDPAIIAAADLETLVQIERTRRIEPVVDVLASFFPQKLEALSRDDRATAIAVLSAAIGRTYFVDETMEGMFDAPIEPRTNLFSRLGVEQAYFETGNVDTARLHFQAILDPLSQNAQRWSGLFKLVTSMPDVYLQVILNPLLNVTEMPLKRFYRYSAPKSLDFDETTGAEIAPTLSFLDMPEDAVLTMGLDAPPAWLTMASEAVYDLDNIRLKDVPADGRSAGVLAVYELKHLLIEGHAREGREIPRGLELDLQTPDGSETLDTIVMANVAYFQFRARPGLYRLKIREGGKSEEIYRMRSVGNLGWDSPDVKVTGNDITLDSLDGLTIYPRVEKRPGMENEELLLDLEGDQMMAEADYYADSGLTDKTKPAAASVAGAMKVFQGAVNRFRGAVGGAGGGPEEVKKTRPSTQATINIFTVASGHLYERMTYIMILSVLRHTSSPVKFWFIENFLSPSFKTFIPHLAKHYGFEYQLVTYAWPHWLRPQKEKQRTIWGYKMLFLDVLFPLDVERIIFVDSDQVVRTDLQDLIDIDLKGAPYAFPPMGQDAPDMENFRFWNYGYWKDFLRGKPYHISALYVVDLRRFRAVAAGDKMRGQYQALSGDPGSLANLDQDLPQTLIHHIPILTLDKEWLWCETWCSYDWFAQAKTIDLCSNPKTHEAKLDRARRQIPEWTELDDEVQALARKVSEEDAEVVVTVPKQETEQDGGSLSPGESSKEHPHDEL